MLSELSIAITKEKELASISLFIVRPERANTRSTINRTLKTSRRMFFEYKSIPLTLAIASKFANFRLLPLRFLSPKK